MRPIAALASPVPGAICVTRHLYLRTFQPQIVVSESTILMLVVPM